MSRSVKITLIIVGLVVLLAAALLATKLFFDYTVRDRGGMENPNIGAEIRPAEGAKLDSASLSHSGTTVEANYWYSLWKDEDKVYFNCECTLEDGERLTVEEQVVDPSVLEELNALALGLDLTETPPVDSTYELLDGDSGSVTFCWDDGTEVTPDQGFDETERFFEKFIREMKGA